MEQLKLNMIPNGVNPVFHASQYDKGRQIRFVLDETLSGAEVTTLYRAKDGTEHGNVQMSVSGNTITDTIPEEVLTDYGIIEGEVNIDGIGSLNFFVEVEKDAYDGGVITTQTATGAIATFETNIETAFVSLKSDINPVQDLHGYSKPWSGGGGKNKFNDTTGTHTINANTDTTITIGDVYLEANTTYTISCKQTPAPLTSFVRNTLSVVGGGTTTYNPVGNDYTIKPMVFTPTVSGTYSIRVWGHTLSANTTYSEFQVEKGSTATAYEPYENICPISGFSALNVTRTGKNLFDNSLMVNSKTVVNGDTVTLTATGNFQGSAFAYMPVKQGYKYALNIDTLTRGSAVEIRYYNSAGTVTNTFVIAQSTIININEDTTVKISIVYGNRTAGAGTFVLKGFNIALGEEYQSYEPYNGQTATVNFGQTVYGGVADVTNGVLKITHEYCVFNGTETITSNTQGGHTRFSCQKLVNLADNNASNENFCSHFIASSSPIGQNQTDNAIGVYNRGLYWRADQFTDITAMKNYLLAQYNANTPVMYVAKLATPIEITTTPENLTAISGENNVYSDTNGDTTVEYYIEV